MIYNLQQTTRLSMTESDPDVVIVGGGPCGLALAIGMRQLGYRRVVVVERYAEAVDVRSVLTS